MHQDVPAYPTSSEEQESQSQKNGSCRPRMSQVDVMASMDEGSIRIPNTPYWYVERNDLLRLRGLDGQSGEDFAARAATALALSRKHEGREVRFSSAGDMVFSTAQGDTVEKLQTLFERRADPAVRDAVEECGYTFIEGTPYFYGVMGDRLWLKGPGDGMDDFDERASAALRLSKEAGKDVMWYAGPCCMSVYGPGGKDDLSMHYTTPEELREAAKIGLIRNGQSGKNMDGTELRELVRQALAKKAAAHVQGNGSVKR